VIGGSPNHALYFVGCVDDALVYLDPHTTQKASLPPEDDDDTYHTDRAGLMNLEQIDPSVALVRFSLILFIKFVVVICFIVICFELLSTNLYTLKDALVDKGFIIRSKVA